MGQQQYQQTLYSSAPRSHLAHVDAVVDGIGDGDLDGRVVRDVLADVDLTDRGRVQHHSGWSVAWVLEAVDIEMKIS